jgi:hypothetical protein
MLSPVKSIVGICCMLAPIYFFVSCGASIGEQLGELDTNPVYADIELSNDWKTVTLFTGSDRWFYFDAQPGFTYYAQAYSVLTILSPRLYKADKATSFALRTSDTDYSTTSYVCTPGSAERVYFKVPFIKEPAVKISVRVISYPLNGDAVVLSSGRTYFGGFVSGVSWVCVNAEAGKKYTVVHNDYSNTKVNIVPYRTDKTTAYAALTTSQVFNGVSFLSLDTGPLYLKITQNYSVYSYSANNPCYNIILKEETPGDYTSPISLTEGVEVEGSFVETDNQYYSFTAVKNTSYRLTWYENEQREGNASVYVGVSPSSVYSSSGSNGGFISTGSSDSNVIIAVQKIAVNPEYLSWSKFALIINQR